MRSSICSGTYFDSAYITKGTYPESFVAPAGCNVSLSNVFWEADKHGADGTLEKIVETWNNDFRSYLGNTVIKWVDGNNNRKSTANGINDGSTPVWYTDPQGKTVDTDGTGQYIKVMHTWANDIYDCVNPDGTPIDLNLYINIVYPDTPAEAVPVVSLANSSTFPTSSITSADQRPHTNGFLFNGYASVVFDYLWEPMARESSYGYFDGLKSNGGYTNDQMNYSLHIYNDKRIYTAAMRYLRYINNENSTAYNFDEDAFGVYGNSKGGWFTFLGNAELHEYTEILDGLTLEESIDSRINAYTSKRDFPNHAGETYYQNGKTEDASKLGITIDGGELQPWLTYASGERQGKEILGYANVLYACCGPAYEDMDVGGAPIFITSNLYDNYSSATGSSNIRTNLARTLDTPSLAFESPVGHMLSYGEDINYGVDTYDALFNFFGYYLKDESTKVVYTTPLDGDAGVSTDGKIVIKFIGSVDETEIAKVTIVSDSGIAASGTWSALYGNTEWTFTPTAPLLGSTTYTVTVPASVKGDNGTTLSQDYVTSFTTGFANATEASVHGLYITATVPALSSNNGYSVVFNVSNEAANIASLYAVDSIGDTDGKYIGSVNLAGSGLYSIDATDYIMEKNVGDEVIFLIKADKEAAVTETFRDEFAALATSGYTASKKSRFANYVRSADSRYAAGEKYEAVTFDGASTVKFIIGMNGSRYPNIPEYEYDNEFYERVTGALFSDNIINNGGIVTEADYGRRFTVTVRLYDTTSRDMMLYIESVSGGYIDNVYDTMDYNQSIYNVNTKAGEWVEFTFEYVIYETDFGVASEYEAKRLMLDASPEGYMENGTRIDCPIYIDYISVTETVTDIEVSGASIVATHDGGNDYKSPENAEYPIALYSADTLIAEYSSWSDAISAYVNGYTLTLQSNFTLTDADNSGALAAYNSVNINLNGYKLIAKTTDDGFIRLKADKASNSKTVINVYDGTVYLSDAPLVSFGGSAVAGSGRDFEVNFSDVFFGIDGKTMATSLASATETTDGVTLSADITFDNCVFSIRNENLPYLKTSLFSSSDTLDISYTVIGGEIRLDSQRWLKIVSNLKTATFAKDSDGNYTSLILPNAYSPDSSAGYLSEDGVANYVSYSSDGYFTKYTLEKGELSTKYGIIPDEYASVDDYPTVIFDNNGNFVKAYDSFYGPLNYFATYSNGENWYMVLRRDFEYTYKYDNLSNGNGTIIVDLDGHTVTCNGVMLYNADAKSNNDITVKTVNGTVLLTTLGAVRILGWKTANYDISTVKAFNFSFEDVRFALADGATTTSLVTYNYVRGASSAGPATNEMTFTNCTFDISGATSATTIFTVGNYNGGQVLTGTYNINGCKIIADNSEYLDVYELVDNTKSSIRFNKDGAGEYIKVVVPTGSAIPNDTFISSSYGAMLLEEIGVEGDCTVYSLKMNNLTTKWGDIASDYASAEDYPWVVFDKNGNCVAGGKLFTTDIAAAACAAGDGSVILLRRDFNMDTDKQSTGAQSLSKIDGSITVDLGGNTLTMGKGGSADAFIRCETYMAGYTTDITVINGKIIAGADPIVRFSAIGTRFTSGYETESATNPHVFNVTLDALNIEWDASMGGTKLLTYGAASGTAASGFNNNLTVKDCNIAISGMSATHYLVATSKTVPAGVTVLGGTVTHDGSGTFKLDSLEAGGTCTYGKGSDGEYTKLILPTGTSAPTDKKVSYEDSNITDLRFVEYYISGSNTVHMLASLVTEYGTISSTYASLLKYPWVVFNKDGTCKSGGTLFTTSIAAAACNAGDGSVILLRRDFNMDTDKQSSGKQSMSTLNGSMTVDLGGHTVTMGNGGNADGFIRAEAYACGYNTYITVTNGKFIVGTDPIVRFSAIDSRWPAVTLEDGSSVAYYLNTDYSKVHNFYITLDGLDFELDSSADLRGNYALLYTTATSGYNLAIHNNNLTVKNCNIDVTNCTNTSSRIFASHSSIGANVTLIGGNVVFGATRPGIQGMNTTNGSTIAFDKEENGNYTSFVFPKSHTKPTTVYYNSNGDALNFVKVAESSTDVTYRFRLEKLANIDFSPKMSVTLDSNLIVNVYIPANNLVKFTFNNDEYLDLTTLSDNKVNIDGAEYYRLSVPLAASAAASVIKLAATIDIDGNTATGTFTFSIIKYAEKILVDGSKSEQQLVLDILSYIRAAYTYFGIEDASSMAEIDELLGEGYDKNNAPAFDGSADEPTVGLKGATLVLDATPAIRFYLPDGADASLYSFYVDGRALNGKPGSDSDGSYIELDVYAYAMGKTITYKIDGAESGSYHINCYYAYAKTLSDDNLVTLVERFAKYCESAENYRLSVIGK